MVYYPFLFQNLNTQTISSFSLPKYFLYSYFFQLRKWNQHVKLPSCCTCLLVALAIGLLPFVFLFFWSQYFVINMFRTSNIGSITSKSSHSYTSFKFLLSFFNSSRVLELKSWNFFEYFKILWLFLSNIMWGSPFEKFWYVSCGLY